MMGERKFIGCYNLPSEYQEKLWAHDELWAMRHDGDWMLPDKLDGDKHLLAVMKSYGIYWDTSFPRLYRAYEKFKIMINPKMGYMEIRFQLKEEEGS